VFEEDELENEEGWRSNGALDECSEKMNSRMRRAGDRMELLMSVRRR
jgi:hypothetical protein